MDTIFLQGGGKPKIPIAEYLEKKYSEKQNTLIIEKTGIGKASSLKRLLQEIPEDIRKVNYYDLKKS